MKYMEYKEVKSPDEVEVRFEKMREVGDPSNPATLGAAGFFDWLTKLSREEGWRPVWASFSFPYIVLEREVNKPLEVFRSETGELIPNPEEEVKK